MDAQKITGIWRGYFTSTPVAKGLEEERYKYEVQIEQRSNNSLSGVTYSYRTTVFYGKAELKGILTLPAKSLILKETKLLDLKVTGKSQPCLMTCYLDYTKIGKLEVLEGTFISVSVNDQKDCGSGKIYLEKVPESDFVKEDFLVKKGDTGKANPTGKVNTPVTPLKLPGGTQPKRSDNLATKPITVKPGTQQSQKPATTTAKTVPKTNTPPIKKPVTRPATVTAKNQPLKNDPNKTVVIPPAEKTVDAPVIPKKEETNAPKEIDNEARRASVPKVLVERENNLVKIINVSNPDILVELYDNATFDNDTISVYHNNIKVISNGCLAYRPLSIRIHCTKDDAKHELVVVAENLGDIPPNTALMVIKSGDRFERYEITLSSNEQRNAKVIINYVPKPEK